MKRLLLATTMLALTGAAHAQLQTGNIGGMPYYLLPASGGCSARTPCSVITYLGVQSESAGAIANDVNNYFAGKVDPHTIVIAPQENGPQNEVTNWGGYNTLTTPEGSQMVAVVRGVEQQMGNAVNPANSVVTGGSLGGTGTQAALAAYGPKGLVQPGVFSAGLSFDAALWSADSAQISALCGVPLTAVHGTADTNQSISYDQTLASAINSNPACGNSFKLVPVQGAGHGTWSGPSGYQAGTGPGTPLATIASDLKSAPATGATPAVTPAQTTTIASIVPPTAPATAASDESPRATNIAPGSGSITDADGHVWTITASGSIMEDGQYTPGGGGTSALTISDDGTIYGQDSGHGPINPGGWFTLGDGQNWQVSRAPGTTAVPAAAASTTQAVAPAVAVCGSGVPSGAFKTVGGRIVGPDGKDWIARGINLYDSQLGDIDAIIAMFPGTNFFRISVGHDGYHDPSYYQAFIMKVTSQGRVVELEHHPDGGGGQDPAYTGSALATESAWYASVAKAFANNPYVWFGTFNEPGTQGGPVSAWELATYNAIRSARNNNLILLEIVGWPGAWNNSMNPADFAGMHGTVWDAHFYGWVARYSTDQATVDKALSDLIESVQQIPSGDGKMPVMVAEYGNSTDGTSIDANGEQSVSAVINAGGSGKVGSAAWAWLPGGNADHLQNGGTLTSSYGQQVALYINTDVIPCTAAQSAANAESTLTQLTAQAAAELAPPDAAQPAPQATQAAAIDPAMQTQINAADAAIAQANALLAKLKASQ
jgi:hypothetical protein